MVDNAGMARLHTADNTTGPLAFDGRTITLVTRTTGFHVGDDARGGLHVRSRPRHVEVLDDDGQRHVVAVHDVERMLLVAISVGALVCASAVQAVRKHRRAPVR